MDDVDPLEYAESTVSPQKGIQVLLKRLCIICALYIVIVDFTLKLKTFDIHMRELQQSISEGGTVIQYLDHNSHLYSAVLACRDAKEQQNATKSTFPVPSEKIPSNKKTEHQWRFNQTTKNPGRKKQGIILK